MARIIENPKELILDEAQKILYNEGYSKVNIRRVAKECNIAVGTIYNYFPTKKELIVEMMKNFWDEYFYNIEIILNSQESFYEKLKKIFYELSDFIKKFRDVWLSSEMSASPDYVESGLKQENIYVNKLIEIIEKLIKIHICKEKKEIDSHKMASFIVGNFISLVQMPYFDYEFFESILKKIL